MPKKLLLFLILASYLVMGLAQGTVLGQEGDSWTVPVEVKIDTFDFKLYFGVLPNATDSFDVGIDTLAPPAGFTPHVIFSIPAFPNSLQADFRSPDSSITWRLQTFNASDRTVHVSWDSSQIPLTGVVTMNDSLEMSSQSSAEFVGDQTLEIVFSSNTLSVHPSPHRNVPATFLIKSYPNPFATAVTFEISLFASHPMVLRIYNILGQEIRSFRYDLIQGNHLKINWDGTDTHGRPVPNGLYLTRLEAPGAIAVRKLYRIR